MLRGPDETQKIQEDGDSDYRVQVGAKEQNDNKTSYGDIEVCVCVYVCVCVSSAA
jgi:hypothetical protein